MLCETSIGFIFPNFEDCSKAVVGSYDRVKDIYAYIPHSELIWGGAKRPKSSAEEIMPFLSNVAFMGGGGREGHTEREPLHKLFFWSTDSTAIYLKETTDLKVEA